MKKNVKENKYITPEVVELLSLSIQPRKNQCNTGSGNLNFCSNGTGV